MAALTIGFASASVFIGHTPFSIWPGLVHLKCSFSFFQRMNFDGQRLRTQAQPGCTERLSSRRAVRLDRDVPCCQQVAQANPTKTLGPDTIRNCIDYLRAVRR